MEHFEHTGEWSEYDLWYGSAMLDFDETTRMLRESLAEGKRLSHRQMAAHRQAAWDIDEILHDGSLRRKLENSALVAESARPGVDATFGIHVGRWFEEYFVYLNQIVARNQAFRIAA